MFHRCSFLYFLVNLFYFVKCEESVGVVTEVVETIGDGIADEDSLIGYIPSRVETFENYKFNYTFPCDKFTKSVNSSSVDLKLIINDSMIAKFSGISPEITYHLDCHNGSSEVIKLEGGHLGITQMSVEAKVNGSYVQISDSIQIRVKRKLTLFDELAFFILGPLILLNKCAFGAKIEISVLKQIFTEPLALSFCLLMQFFGMPLLAMLYATLFKLEQSLALALFVAAACPGGGGGYVISYLVGGDVTLAISASLLSTVVAMGAMPGVIGMYTYFYQIPETIAIPYVKIVLMLCAIAIPISIGMVINQKWPKFAEKFVKIIQPLSLFLIFCGFIFLAVSSRYIIHGPKIGWALAVAVPLSGFILAISFARCLGLTWPFAKAISLESGMKNTVLGIAVIEMTYPQPEADLSSILIIMVTLGHTSLAMLWYFGHLCHQFFCGGREKIVKFTKLDNADLEDIESDEADENMEFIALTKK